MKPLNGDQDSRRAYFPRLGIIPAWVHNTRLVDVPWLCVVVEVSKFPDAQQLHSDQKSFQSSQIERMVPRLEKPCLSSFPVLNFDRQGRTLRRLDMVQSWNFEAGAPGGGEPDLLHREITTKMA